MGFFPPTLTEEKIPVHDIGLFRFMTLNPETCLQGIENKFSEEEDYNRIAPFKDEIFHELLTNLDWWSEIYFDDKPFSSWNSEEQLKIIQGFSDVILFLFRVRGFTFFSAPFDIIGSSFSLLPKAKNSSVILRTRMKESLLDAIHLPNHKPKVLEKNDINWIDEKLVPVYESNKGGAFNFLFEIYESLHYPNPAVQLTQIWAGIEFIVKSSYSRVRRSIKARCAMILGKTAEQQRKIFSDVGKLYNQRSAVIHGVEPFTMLTVLSNLVQENGKTKVNGAAKALWDSFRLLNDLVVEAISQEPMFFSKEDLDALENRFAEYHPELFNA